jgi:uncharacterized protein (TIGR03083 family)
MTAPGLSHERYCAEIVTQTNLLRATVAGADLTTRVPSCPDWNLGELLRHIGEAHRAAETTVRTRATEQPAAHGVEDIPDFDPWLADGATRLADTLRAAGPDVQAWTPLPELSTMPMFWARRFTHETVIHRADATLAVGAEFHVTPDVAADTVDEWMALGALPFHFDIHPRMRELLGPNRTLHFHATDTDAEWLVDLTGDAITWRRTHEKATVAVRGPLTELLLLIYRRHTTTEANIKTFGDANLLNFYLERVSFG